MECLTRMAGIRVRAVALVCVLGLAPGAAAQIGGSGSIQGTVLDSSGAVAAGRDRHRDECGHRRRDRRGRPRRPASIRCRRSRPASIASASRSKASRPFVQERVDRRRARRRRLERHAVGRRRHAGDHCRRRAARAEHRGWAARADDPQRRLHGAAAGDEHRRPARSDRVHVPDARRAVGRPLGQRDGRPGLHQRHLRRRHADHQRGRAGRRPQPVVRHLGGSGRSVPGRDQRHGRHVQRPGRVELRREVRHQPIPRRSASSSSATRRSTPKRSSPQTKPDDNQHEYGFTFGGPIAPQPACSSSSPTTAIAIAGKRSRGWCRSRPRRNGAATSARCRSSSTTRRRRGPNPNGTGFVRDPFPGNIIPANRISPISQYVPVVPAGADQRRPAEQLPRRQPAHRLQQRQRDREGRSRTCRRRIRSRCCSRTASGARRRRIRGGTNAQTALPLPYTETRLVEEIPTTAQVKHTYVIGPRWVNQVSLGFSRLSVPISNATIDGRYPQQAGLTDCPPAKPTRRSPRSRSPGPNAPTQLARHRRAGVHRVPEQLHAPEQRCSG